MAVIGDIKIKSNIIMSKDKALVKDTGETFHIESSYEVFSLTGSFVYDLENDADLKDVFGTYTHNSDPKEDGQYYTLSDGKEYHEKDIIVGMDNIREEKLKKII